MAQAVSVPICRGDHDTIAAAAAFEAWCRDEGGLEHAEKCGPDDCPFQGPHPYAFSHVTGPVEKEADASSYPAGVVILVDSGANG
jgi:hypothetical protein